MYVMAFICYLIALSIAKTGKGSGEGPPAATSSFLWKLTAESDSMELLSLDNKTANVGITNCQKTIQAKF